MLRFLQQPLAGFAWADPLAGLHRSVGEFGCCEPPSFASEANGSTNHDPTSALSAKTARHISVLDF
jgi:hypothetical protein